jgi:hypothetical protein
MSHANPKRDLAVVVDRALDLLLADLEKKKLGKAKRPRAPRTSSKRRPSQSTRRESSARDRGHCSYVSPDGQQCTARAFIEFDHRKAWARGGASDTPNVRLLCRAHNRLVAEEEFGKEFIARKIHLRRSRYRKNREPKAAEVTAIAGGAASFPRRTAKQNQLHARGRWVSTVRSRLPYW